MMVSGRVFVIGAAVLVVALAVALAPQLDVSGQAEPTALVPDMFALEEDQAIQIALNELHYAFPSAIAEQVVARRMLLEEFDILGRSIGPAVNPDIQQSEVWVVAFRTTAPLERTAWTEGDWGDDAEMQQFMDDPSGGGAWYHDANGRTTAYLVIDASDGSIYEEGVEGPYADRDTHALLVAYPTPTP